MGEYTRKAIVMTLYPGLFDSAALALITVLVAAGALKLISGDARSVALLSDLLPKSVWKCRLFSPSLAVRVLGTFELVLGMGVAFSRDWSSQVASGIALVVLAAFALVREMAYRRGAPCGCFGALPVRAPSGSRMSGVLFLALGAVVFVSRLHDPRVGVTVSASNAICAALILGLILLVTFAWPAVATLGDDDKAAQSHTPPPSTKRGRLLSRRRLLYFGAQSAVAAATFNLVRLPFMVPAAAATTGSLSDVEFARQAADWPGTRRLVRYLASRGHQLDFERASVVRRRASGYDDDPRRVVAISTESLVFIWQEPFVLQPSGNRRVVPWPSAFALLRDEKTVAYVLGDEPASLRTEALSADQQALLSASPSSASCVAFCVAWVLACCAVAGVQGCQACYQSYPICLAYCSGIAIDPPEQDTDPECEAAWTVLASQDPNRPQTLQMEYGDGSTGTGDRSTETMSIPAGTGVSTFRLTHYFPYDPGHTWYQQATIVETGSFAQSQATHPPCSPTTDDPCMP